MAVCLPAHSPARGHLHVSGVGGATMREQGSAQVPAPSPWSRRARERSRRPKDMEGGFADGAARAPQASGAPRGHRLSTGSEWDALATFTRGSARAHHLRTANLGVPG